ncbi:hypothetical protein MIDIC_90004 [Alphaproteobacteria bacterium]
MAEFLVSNCTSWDQSAPKIAGLSGGGFVIAWENATSIYRGAGYNVYGQRYGANGSPAGSQFQVNICNSDGLEDRPAPAIAGLSNGGFVVACTVGTMTSYDVYAQRYNADATPLGSGFPVNTYNSSSQQGPSVAGLKSGGFVVVWKSFSQDTSFDYGVHGQMYGANGLPLGSEFPVHSKSYQPSVTGLSDGGFVVTYANTRTLYDVDDVYWRRYDANGVPVPASSDFKANTYASNYQDYPSVAGLKNGGFIVTWNSFGQDGTPYSRSVYGQEYDASGSALGSEFRVNTYTKNTQDLPSVAGLNGGSFVVTWESFQDASGYGIYGQRYSASGSALGLEFLVNSRTSGDQEAPSVASLSNGGFVVAWHESDNAKYGIYGQIYDANGGLVTPTPTPTPTPSVVTPYMCARLSVDVYKDASVFDEANWSVLRSSSDMTGANADIAKLTGYFGRAYVNEVDKVVVIAHRGTEPSAGFGQDLIVDAVMALCNVVDQFSSVIAFRDSVKDYIEKQGKSMQDYSFTSTGHSLGAVLAELLSAKYHYKAFTFDSPGSRDVIRASIGEGEPAFIKGVCQGMMSSLGKAGELLSALLLSALGGKPFESSDLDYVDKNVITYNAAPNFVNTMAAHVGGIYRIYPSIDELSKMNEQPDPLFYYSKYTNDGTFGQHGKYNILGQFDNTTGQPKVIGLQSEWPSGSLGYTGFNHYQSYELNRYYWESYQNNQHSLKLIPFADAYQKKTTSIACECAKAQALIKEQLSGKVPWITIAKTVVQIGFFSFEYITGDHPLKGVNITGDDGYYNGYEGGVLTKGRIIWGTTSFDDNVTTGKGDDTIYLFEGNDVVHDAGGHDTYIMPIVNIGKKTIDDSDGSGEIQIGNSLLSNLVVFPILKSLCPTVPVNAYFLDVNGVGYYFIEQSGNLLITPDCANTVQDIKNSITLLHFSWGNFGISKYTGTDTVVLVGSNSADYLDCSVYKAIAGKCFASALDGEDILAAEIGQNAVLTGCDVGKKVFKLLSSVHRLLSGLETPSDTQKVININGIKEGDVVDLSAIANTSSLVIKQNGTDAYIDFGGGNVIHSQISLGNSYVHFNSTGGNITINNLNMTQIINGADTDTTSWWTLGKILGVVSGGVGALVIAGLGVFFAHKYHVCCFAAVAAVVVTTARAEAKVISHNDVDDGSYMLHHQYDDHPLGNHQDHEDVGVHH